MKYDDFKIFKFSTIIKIINSIKDSFLGIYKNIKPIPGYIINLFVLIAKYIFSGVLKGIEFTIDDFSKIYRKVDFKKYNFSRIYRYFNFRKYNFSNFRRYNFFKVFKYISLRRFNFLKIYKYFYFRTYNFSRIYKYFDIKKYQNISSYATGAVVFAAIIYLIVPFFFNYDKSRFENIICKDLNIKCSIEGKIKYSFYPTPRIKIKDLIIQDFVNENKNLGKVKNVVIKIPFYNLLNKNKLNFTKLDLQNGEINFDLSNLTKYKIFFGKKFNSMPINLKKSEINFSNGKENIATIKEVNFKYKTSRKVDDLILKGDFLNDNIYISFKNKKKENNQSTFFILKFLDTIIKIDIPDLDSDKNIVSGKVSFKQNKNRLTSTFDYKDSQIIFKQANLRNFFLDGKLDGEVNFLPYFNFNLNVDLSSVNFNRLYSHLVTLSEENKKNLFKINRKINGKLNLSANKIFSKRTLIDSFESRIKFTNGNILIEQLLLNLEKFGAADLSGIIKNNNNFSNFKFENNIFFDNTKRFYNKFGIFNKKSETSNLFISGNFDLVNLQLRLDEISNDEKFNEADVTYIEKEFNNLLLENGYTSLFDFFIFKEFIKLITAETKKPSGV